MGRLTESLPTKSAKIRALDGAGYSRSEIAAFLGISYQHVRNVLGSLQASPSEPNEPTEVPAAPGPGGPPVPTSGVLTLDEDGRLPLPRVLLDALGRQPGDTLMWRFEDGELIFMDRHAGVRWAQEFVAAKPGRGSLMDGLREERDLQRAREARLEQGD